MDSSGGGGEHTPRSIPPVHRTWASSKVARGGHGDYPRLRYEYEVAGAHYVGGHYRTYHDNVTMNPHQIVQDHPPGAEVAVFYNPRDPRHSLLAPGFTAVDWGVAGCAGLVGLVMLGIASRFLRIHLRGGRGS
jgi:hypothetical protein